MVAVLVSLRTPHLDTIVLFPEIIENGVPVGKVFHFSDFENLDVVETFLEHSLLLIRQRTRNSWPAITAHPTPGSVTASCNRRHESAIPEQSRRRRRQQCLINTFSAGCGGGSMGGVGGEGRGPITRSLGAAHSRAVVSHAAAAVAPCRPPAGPVVTFPGHSSDRRAHLSGHRRPADGGRRGRPSGPRLRQRRVRAGTAARRPDRSELPMFIAACAIHIAPPPPPPPPPPPDGTAHMASATGGSASDTDHRFQRRPEYEVNRPAAATEPNMWPLTPERPPTEYCSGAARFMSAAAH